MRLALFATLATLAAAPALSQDAQVDFGGLRQDTSLPVEVAADKLQVNQADGTATFSGNVLVTQGEMRLEAAEILVNYAQGGEAGRIRSLEATGGVTLVNGAEAAESQSATYDIDAGTVEMTGDVVLTQGPAALSGDALSIDLATGTGTMQGRVRTVFQPSGQ
ncbi:lipopolysaccharide transport periplasmic protein LptA [Palleronia sediminis]|uniref:Lipopolysaccharide transport periplasmic protein LptA n=1 Tax=Palleronia sediminis TaxID=2547833 RepID=A0A4R6AAQ8_9RHOB|nr:LptA/OstA family protein [Palleronia sediminis]TDL78193.1 lipopolysaccharide transport periplasmic protein LptA [Palleronia sediminis]